MKTKLFIWAMLLMPFICGCSKNDDANYKKLIVGKWFECYEESKDDDGLFYSKTYTEETTSVFYTFSKNGNLKIYYVEMGGEREETGTWKVCDGTLSIEFRWGGVTESVTYALEFENDDRMNLIFYYKELGDKSEYDMRGFQRM